MMAPTPDQNNPDESSETARKLALCHALGQPFSESTVSTWLHLGRKYLLGCAEMERLNESWQAALAAEDFEHLERVLLAAEQLSATDYKSAGIVR